LEIVAAWQLPDMQPSVAGIQYGTADDAEQHDDDMAQAGIQVAANIADLPEQRRVEHWIVTTAAEGSDQTTQLRAEVYDPSGRRVARLDPVQRQCLDLGTVGSGAASLDAAIATRQLGAADEDLLAQCYAGFVNVYSAESRLAIDNAAGKYTVRWIAGGDDDDPSSVETSFVGLAIVALEINFAQIDFGTIQPATQQEASYRSQAGSPISAMPTIRNLGNTDGYLVLQFSSMVGEATDAEITEFSASLGAEQLDAIVADTETCFADAIAPNETRELRLFLHPGGIPADTYAGKLSLGLRTSCGS
jgi:hypothetical protein